MDNKNGNKNNNKDNNEIRKSPRQVTKDDNNSPVYRGGVGNATISFRYDDHPKQDPHVKPDPEIEKLRAAERAAKERAAREKELREKAIREKEARANAAKEKAAGEKAAAEKAAKEAASKENAEAGKAAKENAAAGKAAKENAAGKKTAAEKTAKENAAGGKAAKADPQPVKSYGLQHYNTTELEKERLRAEQKARAAKEQDKLSKEEESSIAKALNSAVAKAKARKEAAAKSVADKKRAREAEKAAKAARELIEANKPGAASTAATTATAAAAGTAADAKSGSGKADAKSGSKPGEKKAQKSDAKSASKPNEKKASKSDGKSDRKNAGKNAGKSDNKSDSKNAGKSDGKNAGKTDGKADGKNAGKSDGKSDNKTDSKAAAVKKTPKKKPTPKKTTRSKRPAGSGKAAAAVAAANANAGKNADAKKNANAAAKSNGIAYSKAKKPKKAKPPKKPKKKHSLTYRILMGALKLFIAFAIVGGIAGGAYAAITISNAPKINPKTLYDRIDVSTHIYDDDGDLVDNIYYDENREIVKYEELPENLKNAFIAIEDKTFWTHKGYNLRRIFGAIWTSLTGGEQISGTSTITQQLARNVYLPEEKSIRSIKRKIIEMYYAHEIEEVLSKEEILTAYLNTIYLGYGCYGVDTAAKKYFSRDVEDLNLSQSAALAALPQAPGVYALIIEDPENPDDENLTKIKKGLYANDISKERRFMVLDLMEEQGYISAKKAKKAKKDIADMLKPSKDGNTTKSAFKDYLLDTVIADLMTKYNIDEDRAGTMVYTKGLNIYSTMDSQAQDVIETEFKKKEAFPEAIKEKSNVEAAMVIAEVGTGQIKAMAGSRKAKGEKLFNRATSPRQPGSSIKPISVYGPALQKSYECAKDGKKFPFVDTGYDSQGANGWGDYLTVSSYVRDEKMTVNGQVWPYNFSRTYSGGKTFKSALQMSLNTCAVKILAQVGVDYSIDMVKKFGITTVIDDYEEPVNDINLAALALGAMSEGVTPLDMALAYAVFPNGGVHNSGICYTKVTDADGNVILEGKSEKTRVLNEGVAWIMTDTLKSVVTNGIGYPAAIAGTPVGGKTGTTDDTWDIWFDGFTANYAAALWIGTDDNTPINTTSATAASMWSTIMGQIDGALGGTYKDMPDNIVYRNGYYYTQGTEPPIIVYRKDTSSNNKSSNNSSKKNSDSKKKKN